MRTTLWRYHLGGGCVLALAYVYLPFAGLRVGARAGGSVAAAALTMVAYLIGIVGYAILIRTRSPGRDRASLIDATVISTGVGMLAWVFLASPYSVDASLPLVERFLSMLYVVLDVLVLALPSRRPPWPSSAATWPRLPLLTAGARGRPGHPPGRPAARGRPPPPGLRTAPPWWEPHRGG